jgi:hypothetical protein
MQIRYLVWRIGRDKYLYKPIIHMLQTQLPARGRIIVGYPENQVNPPKTEFPNLTPRLAWVICLATAWVLATGLTMATFGFVRSLLVIPFFVAWVFLVLLARSIRLRIMQSD